MSTTDFTSALSRGDAVAAIIAAPFAYRSQTISGGFRFTIDSGPMKGRVGIGAALIDAIRAAVQDGAK